MQKDKELHSFEANPFARPMTYWGSTANKAGVTAHQMVSKEQLEIINDIIKGNTEAIAMRP